MIDSKSFKLNMVFGLLLLMFNHNLNSANNLITLEIDSLKTANFLLKAKYFEDNSKYDSSVFYYKKANNNSNLINDWETEVNCLIKIGNILRIQRDFSNAKEYLSNAEEIIQLNSDTDNILLSEIFHVKGTISLNQNDFKNSITLLNKSIELKIQTNGKNDTTLAKSYYNLGTNYYFLENYNLSINYYKKALENGLLKANKFSDDIADYYQGIGIIYASQSKNDSAIYYFLNSLNIKEKTLGKNSPSLARTYSNVGLILMNNGEIEKAINYYNLAEEIYIDNFGNRYFNLGGIYQNKGKYYFVMGNYDKALLYTKNALSIYLETLKNNDLRILSLYMNMGLYFEKKGEYTQAFEYYKKSLSHNENSINGIKTLRNLANLYLKQKNPEQAESYYKQCIEKTSDLFGMENEELALDYFYYGLFFATINNYEKSFEFLNKSNHIYVKIFGNKHRDVARSLMELGRIYSLTEELDSALVYSQKALIAIIPDFYETNYFVNVENKNILPDPILFYTLNMKAEILFQKYNKFDEIKDLETSFKTFEIAICVSDTLQTSYMGSEESKLQFSNIVKSTYSNAIKTAIQLYNITGNNKYLNKAFSFSEKSKAAILLASIKDVEAIKYGGISEPLRELEKNLQNKIRSYNKLIYEEKLLSKHDEKKISKWEEKKFDYYKTYDSLISEFEKNNKEYYSLKYDKTIKSLHEIQEYLNPDDVLIEFTVTDSLLFIFAITNEDFQVFTQSIDSTFFSQIANLRNSFDKNSIMNHSHGDYSKFVDAAHKLYVTLLYPLENIINEKKLIIIPDDKLGYIPFGTLLCKQPDTSIIDYRNLPYLIKKNTISYSYSANLLYNVSEKKHPINDKILSFGPTYNNIPQLDSTHLLFSYAIHDYLVELNNSKKEISKINEIFSGISLVDSNATELNFKQNAKDFDILHLAMHTIVNDTNPMFSKLIFTLNNDSVEDGFLNTYEIYSLELNARMAVLSACNTGSGQLQRGEGIMSLARGFLYAGVPSIIMTLWEVDDVSGSEIMTGFYSYLKKGYQKDEAIRLAKLDYLTVANKINSHPYFWSAYVGIGDIKPIVSNNNYKIILAVSVVICLIFLSSFFYKRKYKAKKIN